jgi:plasmid maintenance system killer protein
MKSRRTKRFRELYDALPARIQRDADAAYARLAADPNHPGLNLERIQGSKSPLFSARVNEQYRVLGRSEAEDTIVWFWIGTHQEYDKLLGRSRKEK